MSETCTDLLDCTNKDDYSLLTLLKMLVCVVDGKLKLRVDGAGGSATLNTIVDTCLDSGLNTFPHGLTTRPGLVQVWHYRTSEQDWELISYPIEVDDTNIYIWAVDQICDGIEIKYI